MNNRKSKSKYLKRSGEHFAKPETVEKKKKFVQSRFYNPIPNVNTVEPCHSSKNEYMFSEKQDLCDNYEHDYSMQIEEHTEITKEYESVQDFAEIELGAETTAMNEEYGESIQEYFEVDFVRSVGTDANIKNLEGRRVVHLSHVISETRKLENHICPANGKGYLSFEREVRKGFQSLLIFKCTSCDERRTIDTNPVLDDEQNINLSCVSGSLNSGKGLSGIQDIIGIMNVPTMGYELYKKYHDELETKWFDELTKTMEQTAQEEWNHAIENNYRDGNIGFCSVIVDGGWSHRSYGHSYSAKSGVAVIIGCFTKKILFVAVRNKYCSICAIAQRKNISIPDHKCYANWSGSSPAMEADIIVEGFNNSESTHKLRYIKFVGDGDSSVYKKIQDNVPYGLQVEKIECSNHLVKRVKKRLYAYASNRPQIRRLLTATKITEICKYCNKIISLNSKKNNPSEENMKKDLKTVIRHCFGDHTMCRNEICNCIQEDNDVDNGYSGLTTEIKVYLHNIISLLINNAQSLVYNETSNRAEQFMHQVAKFTGGKQVFYGKRNSYNVRCFGAGLSYQYGPKWICRSVKGRYVQSIYGRREMIIKRNRKNATKYKRKSNIVCGVKDKNVDYGEHCQQPDMKEDELKSSVMRHIAELNVTPERCHEIEKQTIGQRDNEKWFSERKYRLTASNFGIVSKRRSRPGVLVKNILYDKVPYGNAVEWGISNEENAIAEYENETGEKVQRCGLFVCSQPDLGFLAASPDGLVGCDKIVEVKCPYSIRDVHPRDGRSKVKNFYAELDSCGRLVLNRRHNYYYQIQGQMYVAQRERCDFVIWTPKDEFAT